MEIKRRHIIALVVLEVLTSIAWTVEIWPKGPLAYVASQEALLCPSPDAWALLAAHPALAETLRCRRLSPGARVLRGGDTSLEPPGVWRLYVYDELEAGVLNGGWGLRQDFLMPDGSVIIDETMA